MFIFTCFGNLVGEQECMPLLFSAEGLGYLTKSFSWSLVYVSASAREKVEEGKVKRDFIVSL